MMLRHLVKNKIQVRSTNLYHAESHQPVGGRARGGALRIGNMEKNALLSHGASSAIWDSFMYRSDMYETVFCTTCGRIPIYGNKYDKPICRNCYRCPGASASVRARRPWFRGRRAAPQRTGLPS